MRLLLWVAAQTGGGSAAVNTVDETAKMLERGGLYSVIAVLLVALSLIFWLKEKQAQKTQDMVVEMVKTLSSVLAETNILNKKIEALLARVVDLLDRERR